MEKPSYQFEDFLSKLTQEHREFALDIHDSLMSDGYKIKIKLKSNDFLVSYTHPNTRRSIVNFFFHKQKLVMRIYADNLEKYAGLLNTLPEQMKNEIANSKICKKLVTPEEYNIKCIAGYDFFIESNHYQKCRYKCFQFMVNGDSIPFLLKLIENERAERTPCNPKISKHM